MREEDITKTKHGKITLLPAVTHYYQFYRRDNLMVIP